jgi:non-canonical poly(A) RNA polymerase PAPD5/7
MLSLRDPADETNNLGRKATAIKHIQATTADLSQQLHRILKLNNRKSLLGPLVGPSYMLHRNRRSKLEQYGIGLYTEMQASLAATARAIRETEDAGTDVGSDAEPEPQDLMEGLPGMETDRK